MEKAICTNPRIIQMHILKNTNEEMIENIQFKIREILLNIEMNNNSSEVIRERNLSYLLRLREDKKYKRKYTRGRPFGIYR